MVPKIRVGFKNALAGVFLTTIFLEAAKYVFTLIIGKVLNLGLVYRSLSVSIAFFAMGILFLVHIPHRGRDNSYP